jgi:PEP-CTERM motif
MVRQSYGRQLLLAVITALGLTVSAHAATVTPQLLVNFDGTYAGGVYTLGAGEFDNSGGSFAGTGDVTVAGGLADIKGDVDFRSGLYFSGADLADIQFGAGSLQNISLIMETCVSFDVPVADQPTEPNTASDDRNYNHVLDIQGDTFYRFNGDNHLPKDTQFGYWDGGSEVLVGAADPSSPAMHHIALVWDAATKELEPFVDGVSQGIASTGSVFDASSPYVGYGFFARSLLLGANNGRAIDGKLDAVAFSTFTGNFDASTDFQLECATVPEPSSIALLAIALGGLAWVRRK